MKGPKKIDEIFQFTLETFNCHVRSIINSSDQSTKPKGYMWPINIL